jgi:ribosomal protein S9
MKKITLAVALLVCVAIQAQQQPEPEFMNQLYYCQPGAASLTALEKGEAAMKTKAKLGGFGGSSSSYVMNGNRSPVRIANNDKPSFAVKMDNNMMMDVSQVIVLYKFDIKGGDRQAQLYGTGFMGKNNSVQQGIKCQVKKTSTGVYLLLPEEPLTNGEYGFINMRPPNGAGGRGGKISYTAFGFGIDG